jgi:DUF2897 family protein
MWTAILVITFVFIFIVGGMMVLLKNRDFKLPKDFDPKNSKAAYKNDYEDEDND